MPDAPTTVAALDRRDRDLAVALTALEATVAAGGGGGGSTVTENAFTSGPQTLTSANFGQWNAFTISAAMTCNLPTPVGNAGQTIGIRVDPTSTNLLTLATPAGSIDLLATRIMWAGESALLESDGARWVKIAGKTLPMQCALHQAVAQSVASGTSFVLINVDTLDSDNTGLMASLANHWIVILRAGIYRCEAVASFVLAGLATTVQSIVSKQNGSVRLRNVVQSVYAAANTGALTMWEGPLAAGDQIAVGGSQNSAGAVNTYVAGTNTAPFVGVTEIPSW